MKKILFALIALSVSLTLTACYEQETPSECSKHVDDNYDTLCDVCKSYVKHEHIFSNEFKYDEEIHYRTTTCHDTIYAKDKGKHTFGEPTVLKEPTCSEWGLSEISCTVCGYAKTSSIKKLDHPSNGLLYNSEQHWYDYTCGCKIEKYNHAWSVGEVTKAPTCTEEGEQYFYCQNTVCGAERIELIDKIEHGIDAYYSQDDYYHWYEYICGCHELEQKEEHVWSEASVWIRSTCTKEGTLHQYCLDCRMKKFTPIAVIDHTYNTEIYSYNSQYHWHPSSCGCDDQRLGVAEHTYNSANQCTACTYQLVADDGLAYTLADDHSAYYLTGILDASMKEVIIPAESLGKPVTKILANAFLDCDLKSISIPETIEEIEDGAFKGATIDDIYVASGNTVYSSAGSCLAQLSSGTLIIGTNTSDIPLDGSIKVIGDRAFSGCDEIKELIIPSSVTAIGKYAFDGCGATIIWESESSVTAIEKYSFAGFEGSVRLPESVITVKSHAFASSSASIDLGDCIKTIESYAFSGCTGLVDLYIPDSVTSIGEGAFSGCSSLRSVSLPFVGSSLVATDEQALFGYIFGDSAYSGGTKMNQYYTNNDAYYAVIPSGIESATVRGGSIRYGAFSGIKALKEIIVLDKVSMIYSFAFNRCTGLESITLPFIGQSASLTGGSAESVFGYVFGKGYSGAQQTYAPNTYEYFYVPDALKTVTITGGSLVYGAFSGCKNLKTVYLPEGIDAIPDYTFLGCSSLESVSIPSSVSCIGEYAFSGCKSINELTLPESVIKIGSDAFSNAKIKTLNIKSIDSWLKTELLSSPLEAAGAALYIDGKEISGDIIIPSGVTRLFDAVFYGCDKISSVKIPDTVTEIGEYAFYGCLSLRSVMMGSGVSTIGLRAFELCGLQALKLPDSVTTIGSYAFKSCHSLVSLYLPPNVQTATYGIFYDCPRLVEIFNTNWSEVRMSNNFVTEYSKVIHNESTESLIKETADGFVFLDLGDEIYLVDYRGSTVEIVLPKEYNGSSYSMTTAVFMNSGIISVDTNGAVSTLGARAFENSAVQRAVLTGVKDIYYNAFYDCKDLAHIVMDSDVSSIGTGVFSGCTSLESFTFPDGVALVATGTFDSCTSLKSVILGAGITEIEGRAFAKCTSLESVFGTDGLKKIGAYAFEDCASLKEIAIPSVLNIGNGCFKGCTALTAFNAPSLKAIGDEAFSGDALLVSVTVSTQGPHIVGALAFDGCSSLEKIALTSASIGDRAFRGCASLSLDEKSTLFSAGAEAFRGCTLITNATFDSQESENASIGDYAFAETGLVSLTLSPGIKSIGIGAFMNCTALTSILHNAEAADFPLDNLVFANAGVDGDGITLTTENAKTRIPANMFYPSTDTENPMTPNLVSLITREARYLGSNAFRECVYLKNIVVPRSIITLGDKAFYKCNNATVIEYRAENVTDVGSMCFEYVGCATDGVSLIVANSVRVIPESLFDAAIGTEARLVSISFDTNSTLEEIGARAFFELSSLREVAPLPSSLKTIRYHAFYGCKNIKSIYIPAFVSTIGTGAFDGTTADIYCAANSQPDGWSSYWSTGAKGTVYWGRSA